jgi:hypothetical protein
VCPFISLVLQCLTACINHEVPHYVISKIPRFPSMHVLP